MPGIEAYFKRSCVESGKEQSVLLAEASGGSGLTSSGLKIRVTRAGRPARDDVPGPFPPAFYLIAFSRFFRCKSCVLKASCFLQSCTSPAHLVLLSMQQYPMAWSSSLSASRWKEHLRKIDIGFLSSQGFPSDCNIDTRSEPAIQVIDSLRVSRRRHFPQCGKE